MSGFLTNYGFLPEVPFRFVGASIPMEVAEGDPLRVEKEALLKECVKSRGFAVIRTSFLPFEPLGYAQVLVAQQASQLTKQLCAGKTDTLKQAALDYIQQALLKQRDVLGQPLPWEPAHQMEHNLVKLRALELKVVEGALSLWKSGKQVQMSDKKLGQA